MTNIDWSKLTFSYTKTNTMLCCPFKDGQWGEIESRTDDNQFTGSGDIGEQKIMSKVHTTFNVGKDSQSTSHHSCGQNCQTIQAVSQIHRIACSDNHNKSQRDKAENPSFPPRG